MVGRWTRGEGGREFVEADDVSKAAANKILQYVTAAATTGAVSVEPLTPEERKAAIVKTSKYVVKSGFMERATTYCKDADQLRALLTVVKPQVAVSHLKFALSDSKATKNKRLLKAASDLIQG
jgi:hypothetical protein